MYISWLVRSRHSETKTLRVVPTLLDEKVWFFGGIFHKKEYTLERSKTKGNTFNESWRYISIYILCLADTNYENDRVWNISQHEEESMTVELLALMHLKFYSDHCFYIRTNRMKL